MLRTVAPDFAVANMPETPTIKHRVYAELEVESCSENFTTPVRLAAKPSRLKMMDCVVLGEVSVSLAKGACRRSTAPAFERTIHPSLQVELESQVPLVSELAGHMVTGRPSLTAS